MTFWNPDNIRAACAGTWLVRPARIVLPPDRPAHLPLPDAHAPLAGLSTDSRSITPGQAFLALRGENFDGHRFIADAVREGASMVIIDDPAAAPKGEGAAVLKVADTSKALLRIAAAYRETLKRTKVIAVCGSNGKTTTTRLIDHILSSAGMRGTASRKSFNNAVGVPLTILSAKETDQYLVCEVGTNHLGEIATLAEVVRPDIAVITSIGREHLEGLGDLAGVAAEEASVLRFLKPGGWAIVTDAPELAEHLKATASVVTFGTSEGASLRLTGSRHETTSGKPFLAFTVNTRQHYTLGLIGEHNALNAIAAMAVARRLGIDEQRSGPALQTIGGADMRLAVEEFRGLTILNDAYNANPDSMLAGIDTALSLKKAGFGGGGDAKRIVCILGEMRELGAASDQAHTDIGVALAARSAIDGPIHLAILVGDQMRHAQTALEKAHWPQTAVRWFASADGDNAAYIAALLSPGDLVLVKGSRRVGLERVVQAARGGGASTMPEPTVRSGTLVGVGGSKE